MATISENEFRNRLIKRLDRIANALEKIATYESMRHVQDEKQTETLNIVKDLIIEHEREDDDGK